MLEANIQPRKLASNRAGAARGFYARRHFAALPESLRPVAGSRALGDSGGRLATLSNVEASCKPWSKISSNTSATSAGRRSTRRKLTPALLNKFVAWAGKAGLTDWKQVELRHLMAFLQHERERALANEPKESAAPAEQRERLSGDRRVAGLLPFRRE